MNKKNIYLILACIATLPLASQAQNVGIGTTTPSDQLHTTGTVRFEKYKGTGFRPLMVDDSGRVAVAKAVAGSNTADMLIPDGGCATDNGISSSITITDMPAAIASTKISVLVNIEHTYDGDVSIYLVAPNGQIVTLTSGSPSADDNFENAQFADSGTTIISGAQAPFTGKFRPEGTLSSACFTGSFVGSFGAIGGGSIVPNGTWTLKVYDAEAADEGILKDWSIDFAGEASFEVATNSGHIPRFNVKGGLDKSNIIQNMITGNIGISGNTSYTPLARLDVDGAIKITDGTEGEGKVLTSGANGYTRWERPYGVYSLPSSAFLANNTAHQVSRFAFGSSDAYFTSVAAGIVPILVAPIFLPNGAEIDSLIFYYQDNSIADFSFGFGREDLATGSNASLLLGTNGSTGAVAGGQAFKCNLLNSFIDNTRYGYMVSASCPGGIWPSNGDLAIKGVKIYYSYTLAGN